MNLALASWQAGDRRIPELGKAGLLGSGSLSAAMITLTADLVPLTVPDSGCPGVGEHGAHVKLGCSLLHWRGSAVAWHRGQGSKRQRCGGGVHSLIRRASDVRSRHLIGQLRTSWRLA